LIQSIVALVVVPSWLGDGLKDESLPPLKGLFATKAALATLGIPANRARVGPRTWRFLPAFGDDTPGTQIDLTTDDEGDHLVLRAPLVRLPTEGFEHFYRHLLRSPQRRAVVPLRHVPKRRLPVRVQVGGGDGQARSVSDEQFSELVKAGRPREELQTVHEHEVD
jgi:hypothetical protein